MTSTDQMLSVLTEMRDLLRLMAEPAIAERDKKRRVALRGVAGSATGKKAKAILLMDGTRTRQEIIGACGIDPGKLSVLVKELSAADLVIEDTKKLRLAILLPPNFFALSEDGNE